MSFLKFNFILSLFLLLYPMACNTNDQDKDEQKQIGVGEDQDENEPLKWVLQWEDNFERDNIFSTEEWRKIKRVSPTPEWMANISDYEDCYDIIDDQLILRGLNNHYVPEDTAKYLTGGITTQGIRSFQNGRLEIKAKLEACEGSWPAIWLLPDKGSWPEAGEIDIMERFNKEDFIHQTVHSSYIHNVSWGNPPSTNHVPFDSTQFNVFAVELNSDSITWYVNDIRTFSYPNLKDEITQKQGQYPFDAPFYLIIDMQLGSQQLKVDSTELPIEMVVDWVRFYQKE